MTRLIVKDLSIYVDGVVLLRSFSHQFAAKRIIALVGENGSGKTTLLKTLAGLLHHRTQQVFIDGQDMAALAPKKRAQYVSLLLQHSPEHPYCTARDRIAHGLVPSHGFQHFPTKKALELITATAADLMISHLLDRKLMHMSGGEQRLTHIAKCLINPNTQILLLDEPSVFLDFIQQENLLRTLAQQKARGRLVIFSSHDAAFIKRAADEVMMINHGQFIFLPPSDL
jgi:iron complex transport system ATP-binding protein